MFEKLFGLSRETRTVKKVLSVLSRNYQFAPDADTVAVISANCNGPFNEHEMAIMVLSISLDNSNVVSDPSWASRAERWLNTAKQSYTSGHSFDEAPLALLEQSVSDFVGKNRAPELKATVQSDQPKKSNPLVWYKNREGIGHKLNALFIPFSDLLRDMVPVPGYQIRPEAQLRRSGLPSFIEDSLLETVTIEDGKAIVGCPSCNQKCRVAALPEVEITCPVCSSVWRQRLPR